MLSERDRDATGRPRNARPRDGLGRPLERAATGEPTMPEGETLAPAQALALAQDLIDSGRPFHAHEVLESVWKSSPPAERELWRGLAQLAVGLTHALRGNERGAAALLRRGATAVGESATTSTNLINVTAIRRAALELADLIEAAGLGAVSSDQLTLRLADAPGAGQATR